LATLLFPTQLNIQQSLAFWAPLQRGKLQIQSKTDRFGATQGIASKLMLLNNLMHSCSEADKASLDLAAFVVSAYRLSTENGIRIIVPVAFIMTQKKALEITARKQEPSTRLGSKLRHYKLHEN
jgi:hypothetical protein